MDSRSDKNEIDILYKSAKVVGSIVSISSGINEWYRICIELKNTNFIPVDIKKLDKFIQNPLQSSNLAVHITLNKELKYTIYPPSNISGTIWDLGFISAVSGELMAINSITDTYPKDRLELCPEYMAFYNYVSQQTNPRISFGFSKHHIQKFNDIIMDPSAFTKHIETAMKSDSASLDNFIKKLLGGVCDLFGFIFTLPVLFGVLALPVLLTLLAIAAPAALAA